MNRSIDCVDCVFLKKKILRIANAVCPTLKKLGGGGERKKKEKKEKKRKDQ